MQVDNTSDDKPRDLACKLQCQHQKRAGVKLKLLVHLALNEQFNLPAQGGRGSLLTALVQIPHPQFIEVDALVKRMVVSATTSASNTFSLLPLTLLLSVTKSNDRVGTVSRPKKKGEQQGRRWRRTTLEKCNDRCRS